MGSARQGHSGADMRGNRITDAAYGHWMGGKSGTRAIAAMRPVREAFELAMI